MVLAMNIGHDMMYGPMAAYSRSCSARTSVTAGASLVYQLTSVVSGGVAPFIATLLLARYGSGAVAGYMVASVRDHGHGHLVPGRRRIA